MGKMRKLLAVVLLLAGAPALADSVSDPFQDVVNQYLAANPKPTLSEEAHKFQVQAEFAVQQKRYADAIEYYGKVLKLSPWWPQGHFQLALSLAETNDYRKALVEMRRFMLLAPGAPEARAAQDKIYQWESVAKPEAGKTFKDCPACPEMVELPAGSFDMGSKDGQPDEQPVHQVTISKPFAIGKTEVTQEQWHAVMNTDPSNFSGCGDTCPVEQVSWDDVQLFIQKLNEKTGKHYRLPSEAEWEYACRAGDQQDYCGSDDPNKVAWTSVNSGGFLLETPHPVASKQPNAFGLYDMSGNVWEWVEDTYHDSYNGAPTDGSAWMNGKMRVLRGGSWGKDLKYARAASRAKFGTSYRDFSYGFRLALTLLQ